MPVESSPLIVSFPTEKETFLGFLVQGPYRTTPARDNVPGHDPSNQLLVRETGTLLGDVLRELRDDGLLTVEALQALPLEEARFPAGSMFRPLFDAVGEILTAEADDPGGRRRLRRGRRPGAGGRRRSAPSCSTRTSWAPCAARAARSGSPTRPSPSTSPRCCGATCGTRSASTR